MDKIMEVNNELADKSVNYKKYESMFVGFEFEFNSSILCSNGDDLAEHFGVKFGKTNGKGKRIVKQELRGSTYQSGLSGSVEIEVDSNLYDKDNYVVQVYEDGSVDYEVVTRPVQLKEMGEVKSEVFDYLNNECEADFFAEGKGGLHMTFLTNHHAELSRFDKIVVTNLIQLTRAYFKEIVCAFPGDGRTTRSLEYRTLQSRSQADNCNNLASRYVGINPRRDDDGNIWGIEVRIPDGTDNWDMIKNQAKFWMAMIRHAAIISRIGRLSFPTEVWEAQKTWSDRNSRNRRITTTRQPRMNQLLKILDGSLNWFGYNKVSVVDTTNEKFEKALELQLAGHNLGEIAKGLGYSSGSTDMVKAILNNGGN